jgi:hypothetical protein
MRVLIMGMFDRIHLLGADAERVVCDAGHLARGELQTKSFESTMADYYVFESHLYLSKRNAEHDERTPSREGDALLLTRRESAARVDFSGQVEAYTHCEECDPVCFEGAHWDRVDHRYVWCEWNLIFDRGKLERVEPVRVETRESLRKQMLRDGVGVLPDDDRIVKKHMDQLREGRRPGLWG